MPSSDLTRRQLLRSLGWVGAGAVVGWGAPAAAAEASDLVRRAAAIAPAGSDLGAVDHIVFLMMENRSYDHYFGAYPRGRGFGDHPAHSLGVFAQEYPDGGALSPPGVLLPFHLDSTADGDCTNDLTHAWAPQHQCWNGGAMNSFVKVHTSEQHEGAHGAMTMGYYRRKDLPFYWALADAFTLCDAYHCSVLGPTHPNRLMAISGTIDPEGTRGGPVTATNSTADLLWSCSWPTMPELLQDAGVSWKVYHPSAVDVSGRYAEVAGYPTWNPAFYNPTLNPEIMAASDHVLPYFTAFRNPLSPLYRQAFTPTFPMDFIQDVSAGTLPSVSWIIPPIGFDEHPSASPANGQYFTGLVLDALISSPAVWSRTALILMYDENDGWFDHVAPPTPPAGTPGEFLTAAPSPFLEPKPGTRGILGEPIGLGFRVPCLVISPFSRGGRIATETFDHTSQLKLVAERFRVEVPNVSAWRRGVVGDLTSAVLGGSRHPGASTLPPAELPAPTLNGSCSLFNQQTESGGAPPRVPTMQTMPNQHGGTDPVRDKLGRPARKSAAPPSRSTATLKSSYNHLMHQG